MMTWAFAIVITASMGSFVQDLFLPMFLRRPEAPKKAECSILAMVLDDMESSDLIKGVAHQARPNSGSKQRLHLVPGGKATSPK